MFPNSSQINPDSAAAKLTQAAVPKLTHQFVQ
jgi:hypothetical protein